MDVTLVKVTVKPNHIKSFIEATTLNHQQSIKEPGNLRFDILQSPDNHCCFMLYEAYVNKTAASQHKLTSHYLKWKQTVADWMAEPRIGDHYYGLLPAIDA